MKIASERAWVEELLREESGKSIYGFNTELGHRDFGRPTPRPAPIANERSLPSHNIRPSHARGVYPRRVASLIGYVKAFQLSQCESGVSPETYGDVIKRS